MISTHWNNIALIAENDNHDFVFNDNRGFKINMAPYLRIFKLEDRYVSFLDENVKIKIIHPDGVSFIQPCAYGETKEQARIKLYEKISLMAQDASFIINAQRSPKLKLVSS